ncbi:replication-relaxation family protein [Nonomuraea sp. NEAU-A123]|uniref:replication-relaxation family protein n=1 Tax=Nonomuraea sp. NEAU-A123 TaxID=2839649 RepID=UPI001BE4566C|nr:replication-relaxation family protein [Nonomuraea sp. NEAU-A123]MBT2233210.1 replication-relaxation family protein [Nonomuraea sp. NEAU-A123]
MSPIRYSPRMLGELAVRLTDRDRQLIRLIHDFRVLTAPQVSEMFFDTDDAARKRLLALTRMGILERFRPNLPPTMGTAPYHYVIGETAAAVLASESGVDMADFGYRRDRVLGIVYSQRLAHTVGTNGIAASLYGFARRHPVTELTTWWTEQRCTAEWGAMARPDAYARWTEGRHSVEFFLEYDTGTEPLDRVAHKLDGYTRLTESTRIVTPVLFWVQGERRETNLRKKLKHHPGNMFVPVATGHAATVNGTVDDGPAGARWLPTDLERPRCRLAELAKHWPGLGPQVAPESPEEGDE